MVKNTIHKTKKMSLRYFFNGAMPSEQTENNIKIAQVRLSSSEQTTTTARNEAYLRARRVVAARRWWSGTTWRRWSRRAKASRRS